MLIGTQVVLLMSYFANVWLNIICLRHCFKWNEQTINLTVVFQPCRAQSGTGKTATLSICVLQSIDIQVCFL